MLAVMIAGAMPASAQTAEPMTLVFENRSTGSLHCSLYST